MEWLDANTTFPTSWNEGGEMPSPMDMYFTDKALANSFNFDELSNLGFDDPNGPWISTPAINEGGGEQQYANPAWTKFLADNNYSLKGANLGGGAYGSGIFKQGQANPVFAKMWSPDTMAADVAQLFLSSMMMPGLAGQFGGGLAGNTAAGAVAGGWNSGIQGGDVLKGAATGGVGGGLSSMFSSATPATTGNNPSAYTAGTGWSPSSALGVTNPILSKGINTAVAGTAQGIAGGKNLGDALKGAATTSALGTGQTAMNNFFGNLFNSFGGTPQENDSNFMGPPSWAGGNQFYGPPDLNAGAQPLMGPPADLANNFMGPPADLANNVMGNNVELFPSSSTGSNSDQPNNRGLSFNLPGTSELGRFASSNAGTLAQMLYGMYNNRKQQKMLGNAIGGLQGLYRQNSPYAQQLRAKLNAQAAAQGKRSNTGARETQLQAQLADRAASTMPQLYQMMLGQNQLRNSMASNIFNSLGQLKGLSGLFDGGS